MLATGLEPVKLLRPRAHSLWSAALTIRLYQQNLIVMTASGVEPPNQCLTSNAPVRIVVE